MKKQILVILISILSAPFTFAQQLKPNVIIKAQSESFITELQSHPQYRKTADIMVIYNSKNHYHNKIPKNRNPDVTIERGDKGGMLKAFTGVFTDERLKQLLPEKFLPMTLYLNTSGKILEVEFILHRNTLITAKELEALEKAIKADVWFKIRPEEVKGEDFIDIRSGASFLRVLDRTQK